MIRTRSPTLSGFGVMPRLIHAVLFGKPVGDGGLVAEGKAYLAIPPSVVGVSALTPGSVTARVEVGTPITVAKI